MALGEMLTKLPADDVGQFASVSVRVLVALVKMDRELRVVDAACGALAAVIVKFPVTVELRDDAVAADAREDDVPSASGLAMKMFEILPLNVGHAASVLVALMRVASAVAGSRTQPEQSVEDYISGNVRAYTKQNFSAALSGICHICRARASLNSCFSSPAKASRRSLNERRLRFSFSHSARQPRC